MKIVTGFEDAVIEIDGEVVGSGAWEGVLPAGGHQLVVRKDGYEDYVEDFWPSAPTRSAACASASTPERDNAWIYWTITGVAVAVGWRRRQLLRVPPLGDLRGDRAPSTPAS